MLAIEDSPAGRFSIAPRIRGSRAIVAASAHFLAAGSPHAGWSSPAHRPRFRRIPGAAVAPCVTRRLGSGPGRGSSPAGSRTRACRSRCPRRPWPRPWRVVPLRRMYPQAGSRWCPLSVRPDADAASHYRLGQALAGLADEGVLVIGSGGFVHNLGALAWGQPDAPMPGWARASSATGCASGSAAGNVEALLDWERQAPHARMRTRPPNTCCRCSWPWRGPAARGRPPPARFGTNLLPRADAFASAAAATRRYVCAMNDNAGLHCPARTCSRRSTSASPPCATGC